jgi:DNA polymerase elongation subunit (family B)
MYISGVQIIETMKLITKKRLFIDIETSMCFGWFWRTGKQYISDNQIFPGKETKVISVHWSWNDGPVQNMHWGLNKQCDKKIIKKIIELFKDSDEIIGHNFSSFDLKWIRSRAIKHDLEMHPYHKVIDTYQIMKKIANLHRYTLKYCCQYFGLPAKEDPGGYETWLKIQIDKDKEALDHLLFYGDGDIISTKALYYKLQPHIEVSTHFAVKAGFDKYDCPECGSTHVGHNKMYVTKAGTIQHYMKCYNKLCRKTFKVSNKTYQDWLKYSR